MAGVIVSWAPHSSLSRALVSARWVVAADEISVHTHWPEGSAGTQSLA